MNPDYVDTDVPEMSPEELARHRETMARYRYIETHARIAFRLMLVLIAVFIVGCWQGWM